jgi:hypothetical protein
MNITEILDELFRLEYPNLHADHDPDIERYYYLRTSGYSQEALALYQSRLRVRYPDDEFRAWLMRCYRSRDPAFKKLLAKAYRVLSERALERIKRTVEYIAEKAESYNPRDVYSTIRAAEDILLVLPKDRYEAAAGMERLFRYSQALELRERSMAQAANLVRSYLTDSLSVVEEELRRREDMHRRETEQERRRLAKADWQNYLWQKKHGSYGSLIDLSSVVFSPVDLARIEIPKTLRRIEDQILAYCVKYWNLINDAAFERILFLYSRKYGSKNYDIFLAIRRGRLGKKRDDEILASVMSSLVTGYYYSIQGDRYLQRSWNAIKYSLQHPDRARPALPAPAQVPQLPAPSASAETDGSRRGNKIAPDKTARNKIAPNKKKKAAVIAPVKTETAVKAVKAPVKRTPVTPVPVKQIKPVPVKPVERIPLKAAKPDEARRERETLPAVKLPPVEIREIAPAAAVPAAVPAAVMPMAAPAESGQIPAKPRRRRRSRFISSASLGKPTGSVSDRLRELSGRSYDVYQDRFLAKSRPAIRKVLGAGRGLFFALPEEAEDLVYNFLKVHYADPYMNWEGSDDRAALAGMGFELESLNLVIDECYKSL